MYETKIHEFFYKGVFYIADGNERLLEFSAASLSLGVLDKTF